MRLPEKALKLLRLALNSTNDGERSNAEAMFFAELRRSGTDASANQTPI